MHPTEWVKSHPRAVLSMAGITFTCLTLGGYEYAAYESKVPRGEINFLNETDYINEVGSSFAFFNPTVTNNLHQTILETTATQVLTFKYRGYSLNIFFDSEQFTPPEISTLAAVYDFLESNNGSRFFGFVPKRFGPVSSARMFVTKGFSELVPPLTYAPSTTVNLINPRSGFRAKSDSYVSTSANKDNLVRDIINSNEVFWIEYCQTLMMNGEDRLGDRLDNQEITCNQIGHAIAAIEEGYDYETYQKTATIKGYVLSGKQFVISPMSLEQYEDLRKRILYSKITSQIPLPSDLEQKRNEIIKYVYDLIEVHGIKNIEEMNFLLHQYILSGARL